MTSPLEQFSSMHALLDVVEDMVREACAKPEDWEKLQFQLYRPEVGPGGEAPVGFTAEDQEASFAAFEAMMGKTSLPESKQ